MGGARKWKSLSESLVFVGAAPLPSCICGNAVETALLPSCICGDPHGAILRKPDE